MFILVVSDVCSRIPSRLDRNGPDAPRRGQQPEVEPLQHTHEGGPAAEGEPRAHKRPGKGAEHGGRGGADPGPPRQVADRVPGGDPAHVRPRWLRPRRHPQRQRWLKTLMTLRHTLTTMLTPCCCTMMSKSNPFNSL